MNCSSNLKHFANSRPSALNFKSFSRSLEHFFLAVGQNNFGNKIQFLNPFFSLYLIENWKSQSKWRQVQIQSTRHRFVVWKNLPPLNKNVSSLELKEIRLIFIAYYCNPPVNPILVCNGIFGQYKCRFHCSPHLFYIWILKIFFNTNLKVT